MCQTREEWERQKSYLVRSLFGDRSPLSPISEEEESTSSPHNFINRPESPLPELIIEVEAKKPNLHDDPEELYEALAKEMRRLYRKDFLDIDLNTSSSGLESFNRGKTSDNMYDEYDSVKAPEENVLKDKSQIGYDATEHQIDKDVDSLTQTEISTSNNSSDSITIVSESITAHVDIHSQEYKIQDDPPIVEDGFSESKEYRQSEKDLVNVSKTTLVIDACHPEDEDTGKDARFESESFARDTDASSSNNSSESSVSSSNASPELMRQRHTTIKSLGTPPQITVSKSDSSFDRTINLNMEVDSREHSQDVNVFNQEIEIDESSVNETGMFLTSTPTRKRISTSLSGLAMNDRHKRRLVSYSSSSSFKSVANEAAQTSFSDCEANWSFFWSKFFVGIPTVYDVCSCENHECT